MRFQTVKIYLAIFFNGIGTTLLLTFAGVVFLLMFGFGFIDEPVFKLKLKGQVEDCFYTSPRYVYGEQIICTAKLDNNLTVRFISLNIKKPGEVVIYAEYERPFTHMTKYTQVF